MARTEKISVDRLGNGPRTFVNSKDKVETQIIGAGESRIRFGPSAFGSSAGALFKRLEDPHFSAPRRERITPSTNGRRSESSAESKIGTVTGHLSSYTPNGEKSRQSQSTKDTRSETGSQRKAFEERREELHDASTAVGRDLSANEADIIVCGGDIDDLKEYIRGNIQEKIDHAKEQAVTSEETKTREGQGKGTIILHSEFDFDVALELAGVIDKQERQRILVIKKAKYEAVAAFNPSYGIQLVKEGNGEFDVRTAILYKLPDTMTEIEKQRVRRKSNEAGERAAAQFLKAKTTPKAPIFSETVDTSEDVKKPTFSDGTQGKNEDTRNDSQTEVKFSGAEQAETTIFPEQTSLDASQNVTQLANTSPEDKVDANPSSKVAAAKGKSRRSQVEAKVEKGRKTLTEKELLRLPIQTLRKLGYA